jgi:hypothetical protein
MKRENQLVGTGTFLFCFGVLAYLPSLTGRELVILSWLGSWQVPIGISSMVVGAVLWGVGKLRDVRNATSVGSDRQAVPSRDAMPATRQASEPTTAPQPMPTVQPNVLSGQAPVSPDPKRSR